MKQKLHFSRITHNGSPYEIGLAIGDLVGQSPALKAINIQNEAIGNVELDKKLALLNEFCPNIIEEVNGAADKLKIPIGQFTVFNDYVTTVGACSQIAALPSITDRGHLYVGRSYEFSPNDELNLMNIKEDGHPAHIGFSLFLFGRFDGINEHGLTVTMSSCEFGQQSYGEGLWFPLVLRVLLDRCRTTGEAVSLLKQLPLRCSVNIMIADSHGSAVVAEIACYGSDKKVSLRDSSEYLISTNHYVNSDMLKYDNNHGKHSEARYRAAERMILRERNSVTEKHMKMLLSAKMPGGVYCPYYEDGLGTLRSMFFDVTERRVDVCFGSPCDNKYERVSFDDAAGISLFSVDYENEFPDNPGEFWQTLPPGGNENHAS